MTQDDKVDEYPVTLLALLARDNNTYSCNALPKDLLTTLYRYKYQVRNILWNVE